MEYPFEEDEQIPIIATMNVLQEVVIENIYTFLQDVWPFAVAEDEPPTFI